MTGEKSLSRAARLSRGLLVLSGLLGAFIAWSYYSRTDALAAITVFPVWVWLIPGGSLTGMAWKAGCPRHAKVVLIAWLAILVTFADEPWKLARRRPPLAAPELASDAARALRIVSLNCNGGNLRAVRELAAYRPDVLLLQESPSRNRLEEAARELFGEMGSVVWSADASILARGRLTAQLLSPEVQAHAVWATFEMATGEELDVVSLRLEPGLVRCDLWSPDCWRAQTANRQTRRKQLAAIVAAFEKMEARRPRVIGGDFNAPPGDAVFRLLAPLTRDAFAISGRGWGNTIVNRYPVLRIDQIWIGGELQANDVYAVATEHSDHRAVVCDLLLD